MKTQIKLIKNIIGDDVIIKTENKFYRENIKKYAEDYHNVYVSISLYYAKLIGTRDENDVEYTYKNFKRKLSHIESSFPIWMMAEKNKHSRTYVIDNKISQAIWDIEPLAEIRKSCGIYFIEVTDICDPNNIRIDVHNEANVPNLSDSVDVLKTKLENAPLGIKKMIYCLLDETMTSVDGCVLPLSEDEVIEEEINEEIKKKNEKIRMEHEEYNKKLLQLFTDLAAKYNITKYNK